MSDPWGMCDIDNFKSLDESSKLQEETVHEFEDNFVLKNNTSLPDSDQYLKSLEKKLFKIKNNQDVLRQLSSKREDCLGNLLNDRSSTVVTDNDVELDAPISSHGDSAVQDIYRHICPIQPLNVGEIIHILKHDQLEEQNKVDQEKQDHQEQS